MGESVQFIGGPKEGTRVINDPELSAFSVAQIDGKDQYALYERQPGGPPFRYQFTHIDSMSEVAIRANVVKQYESPDPDIWPSTPTDDHVQKFIQVGYRKGEVDELIAPLIEQLWRLSWDTIGSCQCDAGKSAWVAFPVKKDGEAYAAFLAKKRIRTNTQYRPQSIRLKDGKIVTWKVATVGMRHTDLPRAIELLKSRAPYYPASPPSS